MKYSEFIKGNEGFQYSINIQFDYNNENKIKGYIPTRSSINVLSQYIDNTVYNDRNKATLLIGPYGKGKSHLLLILLALMCRKPSETLNKLVNKIKSINYECAEKADDLLKNKTYLPIILNFNSDNLNQAFLVAIKNALLNDGKETILPYTYFDSACNVINGWKYYPETYKKFEILVKEKAFIKTNEFINKLGFYDKNCYEIFKDIFNEITSGVEFNPLVNTDIVKLIEEINHKLKEEYDYDGTIIVFDEFSKFIEASDETNNIKDLKILQDIAELCDRSSDPQLHLVCIIHKTINEYISKISKDKIDAWRTIEGRFREVDFNATSQQNYELISNAIQKNEKKLNSFIKQNREELEDLTSEKQNILFSGDYNWKEYFNEIVKGCFPLDPYTTYVLPILSEKVAQNERTLFTYLSKDEPNSLVNLIKENTGELKLVTLDTLYDYFEPLFEKEIFNDAIHQIWLKVDTAIKRVDLELEIRVLKALGIIYIINDFKIISPDQYHLKNCLNIDLKSLKDILDKMIQSGILFFRESNDTLDFMPNSSINVNNDIKNLAETKFLNPKISKDLSEILDLKFILPKKYNDKYKIIRFFRKVYITIDEMLAYNEAKQLLDEYKADGIILNLIYFDNSQISNAEEWIAKINDNRILIVVPDNEFKIFKDISKYEAIKSLKGNIDYLKEGTEVENQLEIINEDLTSKISKYTNENYDIADGKCTVYINEQKYKKLRAIELSAEISKICDLNFKYTPQINNELINKNKISSPVQKARDVIVDSILDGSYTKFDYTKNSLECTLFRATLINQGLLDDHLKQNIELLINEIKEFFIKAENEEISFKKLYDDIITNKKSIGIRKGSIPIYLAYILKDYNDEVIIYFKSGRSKKEVNVESKILNNINLSPKDYIIRIEKGTEERKLYAKKIDDLFSFYQNRKISGNQYQEIIKGMQGWLQSLSLYTKNSLINIESGEQIDESIIKLRKELLKYEINSRQFILIDLPKILQQNSLEKSYEKIVSVKNFLDKHIDRVKKHLIHETQNIFDKDYCGSLSNTIRNWFMNLSEDKKTYLFNGSTKKFTNYIPNMGNDDDIIIEKLAVIFTDLSIEDWNDSSYSLFIKEITESKEIIENLEISNDENNDGLIKIIIQDKNSNSIEKAFNKIKIGANASTLFNSIEEAIDEYGDSVDDNEKRNILISILQRYI